MSYHSGTHCNQDQHGNRSENNNAPPPGYDVGGFAQSLSAGPPPGADPKLWQWFSAVDVDRSSSITADELQQCLVNGDWTPFDLDTVKLLISIFDTDRSGTIGFSEFCSLWKYIKDWQATFHHFDIDRSGSINKEEFQEALRQFGYNLSPHLLHLLRTKYAATPASKSQPRAPPVINFDHFVRACVVVKTLTKSFQKFDTQRTGWIQINYEQFMQTMLSAP